MASRTSPHRTHGSIWIIWPFQKHENSFLHWKILNECIIVEKCFASPSGFSPSRLFLYLPPHCPLIWLTSLRRTIRSPSRKGFQTPHPKLQCEWPIWLIIASLQTRPESAFRWISHVGHDTYSHKYSVPLDRQKRKPALMNACPARYDVQLPPTFPPKTLPNAEKEVPSPPFGDIPGIGEGSNPCRQSSWESGRPLEHVSCGSHMVGRSAVYPKYVLNCVSGRLIIAEGKILRFQIDRDRDDNEDRMAKANRSANGI